MEITSKSAVKKLLQKYKVRPRKRFGQNFLVNPVVFKKIIETANLNPKDMVLEIGPGIGNLTSKLAKRAKKVIAVEKDPLMVMVLKDTLKNFSNVAIIQGDILKVSSFKFQVSGFKVVANLPYYIVSPVIRKFLEEKYPPEEMILMVQKEVAQRICAKPPRMNLLAASIQFYAEPKIISYVSKKSFWPSPKVDSAIIKIVPRKSALSSTPFRFYFFRIVKAGFSQPRKQLINNLSRSLKLNRETVRDWLLKNNIQPTQRAETLKIEDWINLLKSFKHSPPQSTHNQHTMLINSPPQST